MATNNTKATKGEAKATAKASEAKATAKPASKASEAKAAAKPATQAATLTGRRATLASIASNGGDAAVLRVVREPRVLTGSQSHKALQALLGAKTVGDYRKAREKAGLDNHIGGYLPHWLETGDVIVARDNKAADAAVKARKAAIAKATA